MLLCLITSGYTQLQRNWTKLWQSSIYALVPVFRCALCAAASELTRLFAVYLHHLSRFHVAEEELKDKDYGLRRGQKTHTAKCDD